MKRLFNPIACHYDAPSVPSFSRERLADVPFVGRRFALTRQPAPSDGSAPAASVAKLQSGVPLADSAIDPGKNLDWRADRLKMRGLVCK
jgi:hypothetical protein